MNKLEVTQMHMLDNGGMSYVVTLRDNGFIIIDGGTGFDKYEAQSKTLWDFLASRSKGKPVIHGWFFTHYHYDHVSLAAEFLVRKKNDIDLKGFYINPYGNVGNAGDADMNEKLNAAISEHPEASVHYLKTGETLLFPCCRVDIMLSESDLSPFGRINQNYVSAAFKFTFESGRSFTVLGDCDTGKLARLIDKDDPVYRDDLFLKTDVLQVAHHGLPLGDDSQLRSGAEVMKRLSPEICLFPQHKERFETDERFFEEKWYDNYYLIHSGAKCFHHSKRVSVNMDDLSVDVEE